MAQSSGVLTMSMGARAGWSFWAISIFLVLFNAFGVFDFSMTQLQADFYMSAFTDEQLAYFYGFPLWMVLLWGASVSVCFIGSICLLLKMKLAVPLYLAGLIGYVASSIHNMVLNPMPGADSSGYIAGGIIFVVLIFALWYASYQSRRGVLK